VHVTHHSWELKSEKALYDSKPIRRFEARRFESPPL
jgi:hypothetical protein